MTCKIELLEREINMINEQYIGGLVVAVVLFIAMVGIRFLKGSGHDEGR